MCKQIKKHRDILSKNELKAIDEIKDEIKTYLKGFIAKGAGACVDPNLGLCWDTMNPTITVNFVNPKGEVKTRRHQFLINSIGIKFVCSVDICCIRLTGLSFNYYDSNKELNLGSGIDMSACAFGGLNFVYCSIKDMPGCGVVLVSIPVGVAAGLSYVYGGKIVPVK
jgi:hypothetical protein